MSVTISCGIACKLFPPSSPKLLMQRHLIDQNFLGSRTRPPDGKTREETLVDVSKSVSVPAPPERSTPLVMSDAANLKRVVSIAAEGCRGHHPSERCRFRRSRKAYHYLLFNWPVIRITSVENAHPLPSLVRTALSVDTADPMFIAERFRVHWFNQFDLSYHFHRLWMKIAETSPQTP